MKLKASLKRLLGREDRVVDLTRAVPRYARYRIGEGTYGTPKVTDWEHSGTLEIGSYTSIGDNVNILLGGEHRTDWVSTYPFNTFFPAFAHIRGHPRSKGAVIIGSDVWIGFGATILSGVTIGHGAVVGAGSVVSRSVEPYSIVAGAPARHIRFRFTPEIVTHLLGAAWWDLPPAQVHALVPLLQSPDVAELLKAVAAARGS